MCVQNDKKKSREEGQLIIYVLFFFGPLRNALQLHYGLSTQNIVHELHHCIVRDFSKFKSESWALHYEQITFGVLRKNIKECLRQLARVNYKFSSTLFPKCSLRLNLYTV